MTVPLAAVEPLGQGTSVFFTPLCVTMTHGKPQDTRILGRDRTMTGHLLKYAERYPLAGGWPRKVRTHVSPCSLPFVWRQNPYSMRDARVESSLLAQSRNT
jgi:hypothetical protein